MTYRSVYLRLRRKEVYKDVWELWIGWVEESIYLLAAETANTEKKQWQCEGVEKYQRVDTGILKRARENMEEMALSELSDPTFTLRYISHGRQVKYIQDLICKW